VAGQFGLRSGELVSGWFTAYDESSRKYGPGLIQVLRLVESAPGVGIRLIDMGKGDQGYKQKLRSYDRYVAEGVVTVGRLATAGYRVRSGVSRWVRWLRAPWRTR
jgi:CelD/BcsL family acetyltransferase involved in cellulose biosynthesis